MKSSISFRMGRFTLGARTGALRKVLSGAVLSEDDWTLGERLFCCLIPDSS